MLGHMQTAASITAPSRCLVPIRISGQFVSLSSISPLGSHVTPRQSRRKICCGVKATKLEESKSSNPNKIIDLISACVEANAIVQTYEVMAGRAAMIGFVIACLAETVLPHQHGLFGQVEHGQFSQLCGALVGMLSIAAVLATMSKKKLGNRFKEAVITSLTALSSQSTVNVDKAVDYVFESVFNKSMINQNFSEVDEI